MILLLLKILAGLNSCLVESFDNGFVHIADCFRGGADKIILDRHNNIRFMHVLLYIENNTDAGDLQRQIVECRMSSILRLDFECFA